MCVDSVDVCQRGGYACVLRVCGCVAKGRVCMYVEGVWVCVKVDSMHVC